MRGMARFYELVGRCVRRSRYVSSPRRCEKKLHWSADFKFRAVLLSAKRIADGILAGEAGSRGITASVHLRLAATQQIRAQLVAVRLLSRVVQTEHSPISAFDAPRPERFAYETLKPCSSGPRSNRDKLRLERQTHVVLPLSDAPYQTRSTCWIHLFFRWLPTGLRKMMTHTPAAPAVGSAQTVAFVYDTANRRTKVTLPNTVEINYAYDNASQLSSITYKKGATTLGDLTYTYDLAGRRAVIGGSYARTNLPTAIPAANAVYNVNNQQTAWGTASALAHTYDLNGNLTSDGTYTYLWNARNQLREVKQGATTVALYEYDAFGRRKQKSINGTITKFLYDGINFVQEQNSGGVVVANLLPGREVDELYARIKTPTTTPQTNSFLLDHLRTVIAESDAVGAIATSYTYEPYGKTQQADTSSDNAQRYTGREQDFGDIYYYRARYYSTNESRFTAEDPIGKDGGINLYSYAEARPIDRIDPLGLVPIIVPPKWDPSSWGSFFRRACPISWVQYRPNCNCPSGFEGQFCTRCVICVFASDEDCFVPFMGVRTLCSSLGCSILAPNVGPIG
jgi:RHS repeat-associated protein